MKKAFSNDESLGKPKNAGLKNGPKFSEVTVNGKPVKAVAGQKVSQVMNAARVKVTYSCRKGENLNGSFLFRKVLNCSNSFRFILPIKFLLQSNLTRDIFSFSNGFEGDCGTCELLMNGRVEKACTAVIPSGKCMIQTT
ncbi:hypothetical protein ACHAXS_003554 [Conticribra weissflogii]